MASIWYQFRRELDPIVERIETKAELDQTARDALRALLVFLDKCERDDAAYDELEGAQEELRGFVRDLGLIGKGYALGHVLECDGAKGAARELVRFALVRYARAARHLLERLDGNAEPPTKRLRAPKA
jgi:hypothetical protein